MNPADDFRELKRLAHVALDAAWEGRGWTDAYAAQCKQYALICERCCDAAYHAAYIAAAREASAIVDRGPT